MTISHLKMIIYNNIISSQVNQILFFRVFNYLDWLILEGEEKRAWCPGDNEERPPCKCPPSRGRHCLGRKWVLWHWRHVNWSRDRRRLKDHPYHWILCGVTSLRLFTFFSMFLLLFHLQTILLGLLCGGAGKCHIQGFPSVLLKQISKSF